MTPLLILSHGQPSDPGPAEARLKAFGAAVASHCPDRPVETATLAAPDRLSQVVSGFSGAAFLVYPLFMSDGWFVSHQVPKRLAETRGKYRLLPPFGLEAELPGLVARTGLDAVAQAGLRPERTTVVLTAHGSPRDPRPSRAAWRQARRLRDAVGAVRIGFVDETPSIEEAARTEGPAVTLPLFAATNGHVAIDVARALDAAGFDGPRLPPIGEHPDTPGLIARSVTAAEEKIPVE